MNTLAEGGVRDIDSTLQRIDGLLGRHRTRLHMPTLAATAFLLRAVGVVPAAAAETPAKVDPAPMENADRDAANWLSYGRTCSEQRFSPLTKITADNCSADSRGTRTSIPIPASRRHAWSSTA
jgi:hypothetical protein